MVAADVSRGQLKVVVGSPTVRAAGAGTGGFRADVALRAGVCSYEAARSASRASGAGGRAGPSPGGVPPQTEVVELCCCTL